MNNSYKPEGYNSLSPYFVIKKASKFIAMLERIFHAEVLRKYDLPDGSIMHAEMRIDDSVIMLGDAGKGFKPNQLHIHIYVSDVDEVFYKALDAGCIAIERPNQKENQPDRRGAFRDYGGNVWSVSTQVTTP